VRNDACDVLLLDISMPGQNGVDVLRAIRSVAQGRRFVTEAVGELLANGLGSHGDEPPHTRLRDRELQVFLLLANGESVTGSANVLNLSVETIGTYRSRVLEKLNLRSNSDVTDYAMKNGLIQ
jgi:DNA-binding NarL/FixJ family response regulator